MLSNMFPKLSISDSPKAKSASSNFGGVAVLAVLAVIALSLLLGTMAGSGVGVGDGTGGCDGTGGTSSFCLLGNENVRPAFFNDHPLKRGPVFAGRSGDGRLPEVIEFVCESFDISVDEGIVDEELRRAEDAALPYGAVEAVLFVPLLPLNGQVKLVSVHCHTITTVSHTDS